jgi:folate-binding protein YgfZ
VLRLPECPFTYFAVRGADRIDWLQGQLTQDVASLEVGKWKRTAILSATGQMTADGAVWILANEVVLGIDRLATGVAELLSSRIIMEDVRLAPVEGEWLSLVDGFVAGQQVLPMDHVGTNGFDILNASESVSETIDYETARIEAAVPLAGVDYDAKTLAMELGPHFVSTRIAFGKGCYTGQEVVERIQSRGHTNRQWVGLRSDERFSGADGVRVTSSALSPNFGHIALAFVPVAGAEPGTVLGNATVAELPFQ